MHYRESTRFYNSLFQILGISPIRRTKNLTNQKKCIKWEKLPALSSIVLTINVFTLIILSITTDIVHNSQDTRGIILVKIDLAIDMILMISVLLNFLLYKSVFYKISNIFEGFEMYFYLRLNHQIPYELLRAWLQSRFGMIFGLIAQYLFGYIVRIAINSNFNYIGIQMKLLQTMATFNYLHLIYHIDLLSFHLKQLNDVIEGDMAMLIAFNGFQISTKNYLKNRIICYKIVHFQLWTVMKCINVVFGWSLLAMVIYAFVDMTFCTYWTYEVLRDGKGFMGFLSI